MVFAIDENTELSSAPHIRQTRMNHQPGSSSSSSHALDPWFKDLKKVNIKNPTPVEIVFADSSSTAYAIHPYFVLTRREFVIEGFHLLAHMRTSGLFEMQNVRKCTGDDFKEVVLIQLTNPIMLNNPVARPFSAENYSNRATDWAKVQVQDWIRQYRPDFRIPPQESLTEFRHYDPTKVVMTHNGTHIGPGFAVHPHIVITSRNYIQRPVGVLSYTANIGHFETHRIQNIYMYEDIGVVRLHDRILLDFPVPDAFTTQAFSYYAFNFVNNRVRDWIREFNAGRNQMHRV